MKPKSLVYLLIYLLINPANAYAQFPGSAPNAGGFGDSLISFGISIINWILGGIFIFSLLGFPISAILYVSSGGADDRLAEAGKIFKYSLFGFIFSVGGYFLLRYVVSLLGV